VKSRSRVEPIAVQARFGGTIVMMCDSNRIMILQILCVVSNDEDRSEGTQLVFIDIDVGTHVSKEV